MRFDKRPHMCDIGYVSVGGKSRILGIIGINVEREKERKKERKSKK